MSVAETKLESFERAKEFYERAEGFLIEHEACHSLMLGIARRLVEYPKFFGEEPYLATIEYEGGVVAATYMTPPYNPVLSLGFTPGGLQLLAEDLHESYPTLPGVLGPVDAARSFAERARSSIELDASVAITRCPALTRCRVSRPLPHPSSSTRPSRSSTGSSSARIPGAHASAWKPKPR